MCCFSHPVQSVSATQIFAHSVAEGRQQLVYSMTLKAAGELAMVLPLPVRAGTGEKGVPFIDLSGYPNFFADLNKGFRPVLAKAPSRSDTFGKSADKLEVVTVGSFEASFVPTIADFSRLDERFRLPAGTWEKLPVYRDYGFAVFKLKPGDATIHPMAFTFPRARREELFFPTMHIHDGKVHERAEFDHQLFLQRGEGDLFSLLDWDESAGPAAGFMAIEKAKGLVDAEEHCYRRTLHGMQPNRDFLLRF